MGHKHLHKGSRSGIHITQQLVHCGTQLKALAKPPASIHHVYACVAVITGWDSSIDPHEVAWQDCREMLAEYAYLFSAIGR